MLDKIICVRSVGALNNATPNSIEMGRVTLIYGENARGKSTLAALLHACSTGTSDAVMARATIGATSDPKLVLRFVRGGVTQVANFENAAWSSTAPELTVFDQGFIERNVYAGSEVNPEHHQALLDFAIGSAAVTAKRAVDEAGARQLAGTRRKTAAEDKLRGYRGNLPISEFVALKLDPDVDTKIATLNQEVLSASASAEINRRPQLDPVTLPQFDVDKFFSVLGRRLDDVHTDAERTVREHLHKHADSDAETWVARGQQLLHDDLCPFCGQAVTGIDLIQAYKTHFNMAYRQLTADVGNLASGARAALAHDDGAAAIAKLNDERCLAWAPQLTLAPLEFDATEVRRLIDETLRALLELAERKIAAPADSVDAPQVLAETIGNLGRLHGMQQSYNGRVTSINADIAAYKQRLSGTNVAALKLQIGLLTLQKGRHSQDVVEIVDEWSQADQERGIAETAKNEAKERFNALMVDTLQTYQTAINKWLRAFGANFTVEALKPNYSGTGLPRTEYGIRLSGRTVPAGRKLEAEPSFKTVLSDGDKRTLALAFFLARVLGDADVATRIVVLDDAFVSMDKHRRAQTVQAILTLTRQAEQVVVMAHDGYFLRDLANGLSDKKISVPTSLQLERVKGDYTELVPCDLDALCASPYYKHYAKISEFVEGGGNDLLDVAKCGRPLLEGHLHRRFPRHVADGVPLGVTLDRIKTASPNSPLDSLRPSISELLELNDFFSAFLHDTDGKVVRDDVTDNELRTYCASVLRLIHSGRL